MKAKYVGKIGRCSCGNRYTRLTEWGKWFWCLTCDAVPHSFNCKRRDRIGNCLCGRLV